LARRQTSSCDSERKTNCATTQLLGSELRFDPLKHVGQKAVPQCERLFRLLVCRRLFGLSREPLLFLLSPLSELHLAGQVRTDFTRRPLVDAVRVNRRGQVGTQFFFEPRFSTFLASAITTST
jgi:hypothetical protein